MVVLVGAAVGEELVDRRCSPNEQFPQIERCVVQERPVVSAPVSALLMVLVVLAVGCGVVAIVRWRSTVFETSPVTSEQSRYDAFGARLRVLLVSAGLWPMIAGMWLRPSVSSEYEAVEMQCTSTTLPGGLTAVACRGGGVEVLRTERTGSPLGVVLIVVGILLLVAGVVWWGWSARVRQRSRWDGDDWRAERPVG